MGGGANGAVESGFGLPGTQSSIGLNEAGNPINPMPWAGDTFKLDLAAPFQNFFQSLMAPVTASDFDIHYGLPADTSAGLPSPLSGFVIPSLQDIAHAFQGLLASSVVVYDPFTAGSPFCMGACVEDGFPMLEQMVKDIGSLFPNNPLISHWLDLVNTPSPDVGNPNPNLDMTGEQTGSANWATVHQIGADTTYFDQQQSQFDLGNPLPSDPPIGGFYGVDTPLPFGISPSIQNLIEFMQTSGIQGFVHDLANLFGYTPIDYGTDAGTGVGEAAGSTAADSTDLSSLSSELTNPADWASLF
jgi:hypothetical protein